MRRRIAITRQRCVAVGQTLGRGRTGHCPTGGSPADIDHPVDIGAGRQAIVKAQRCCRARGAIGQRDRKAHLRPGDHRIGIGGLADAKSRHKIRVFVRADVRSGGIPHIAVEIISNTVQRIRKSAGDGRSRADSRAACHNVQVNCHQVASWINKQRVGRNTVGILTCSGLPI